MTIDYSEIRRGFYSALPLYLGFIPLSLILGTQAHQMGQTPLTAYLMSALNFAGGSEFAAVSLWSATPPVLLITITTFLINSRHIVMGASLAPYIRQESGLRVFFIYCVMCDECWALSIQDAQRRAQEKKGFSFWYHMGVGLSLWSMWSITCGVGALIGTQLGDMNNYGFAMALPATFIGLSVAMRPREQYSRYLPIALSFIAAALTTVYIDRIYAVGAGAVVDLTCAYVQQVCKEKREEAQCQAELQPQTSDANAQPNNATAPSTDSELITATCSETKEER